MISLNCVRPESKKISKKKNKQPNIAGKQPVKKQEAASTKLKKNETEENISDSESNGSDD